MTGVGGFLTAEADLSCVIRVLFDKQFCVRHGGSSPIPYHPVSAFHTEAAGECSSGRGRFGQNFVQIRTKSIANGSLMVVNFREKLFSLLTLN
jgi:hypothetical protein